MDSSERMDATGIAIAESRCLNARNAGSNCRQCERVCHANAIRISPDGITLDEGACIGCGLCIAACPMEVFASPSWSERETVEAVRSATSTTGLPIHEWVSVGALLVALVHTILHWDWSVQTARRFLGKLAAAPRWNLVIDVAALVAFMTVMVSGFGVSRHVLLAFGYFAPGYFVWKPVHSISAVVLLTLVIVHLAMHWKWIATAVRTRVARPGRTRLEAAEQNAGAERR